MTKQLVLLFLFSWLFTACSKKADHLGSEYQSLVGKWEIVNSKAERVRITFKTNGKIVFEQGAERSAKYKVTEMIELFVPTNPTPETWHTFVLMTKNRQIGLDKKLGHVDTIITNLHALLIDTASFGSDFKFHRVSQ